MNQKFLKEAIEVSPEDIKKHLADKHQFEAPDDLSPKELDELHKKLHGETDKAVSYIKT